MVPERWWVSQMFKNYISNADELAQLFMCGGGFNDSPREIINKRQEFYEKYVDKLRLLICNACLILIFKRSCFMDLL